MTRLEHCREPGRATLLNVFREGCAEYYRHGQHKAFPIPQCTFPRIAVWMALEDRYGKKHRLDQLERWRGAIKAVLDRAERRTRQEVRDGAT